MAKKWIVFWLILPMLFFITTCSLRDYSSPIMEEYYKGPYIYIYQPQSGSVNPGNVLVIGNVFDASGVKNVSIHYENTVFSLNVPSSSSSYYFSNMIYFTKGGNQTITISAVGGSEIEASKSVSINIDGPSIRITNDILLSNNIGFLNINNILLKGTASYSNYGVSNILVFVRISNSITTNPANLFLPGWQSFISLNPNTIHTIDATVYGSNGVTSTDTKTLVVDMMPPTNLTPQYPTNNQVSIPPQFSGNILVQDALSGVRELFISNNAGYNWSNSNQYPSMNNNLNQWWYGYWGLPLTNGPHTIYIYAVDYTGNKSAIQAVNFTVDASIPVVDIYMPYIPNGPPITNLSIYDINGYAYVQIGSITNMTIRINNGPRVQISNFVITNQIYWTNYNTAFIPNATNNIEVIAVSSSGKASTNWNMLIIDTQPPSLNINPANGLIIINTNTCDFNINASDSMSGISYIYITNLGTTISNTGFPNFYGAPYPKTVNIPFTFSTPGGGVLTNVATAYDGVGNFRSYTNVYTFYQAIFVAPYGNDLAYGGFTLAPYRSIQKGLDMAHTLGVKIVVVAGGKYTNDIGIDSITLYSDIALVGSYPTNWTPFSPDLILYPSIINGMSSTLHGMSIVNVTNCGIAGFIISNNGNYSYNGGGIYISNSTVFITNNKILYNNGGLGGGFFCNNSTVYLFSNIFFNNYAISGSSLFSLNSALIICGNQISNNLVQPTNQTGIGAAFINSYSFLSNNSFFGNYVSTGKAYISLYVTNGSLLFYNNILNGNFATSNIYELFLDGTLDYFDCILNSFSSTYFGSPMYSSYAIFENTPISNHNLKWNSFYTNNMNFLYHKSSGLEISNTNPYLINIPAMTGATYDSTNNYFLP